MYISESNQVGWMDGWLAASPEVVHPFDKDFGTRHENNSKEKKRKEIEAFYYMYVNKRQYKISAKVSLPPDAACI